MDNVHAIDALLINGEHARFSDTPVTLGILTEQSTTANWLAQ